jgi:hypothetical protein
MAHRLDRRRFGAILWAAALAFGVAGEAAAMDGPSFDGTWGGAKGEVTAQVIIAGGSVIGWFWRGDYLDVGDAKVSADGQSLAFAFRGGEATLTRTGEKTATLDVREGGRTTRLDLTRD